MSSKSKIADIAKTWGELSQSFAALVDMVVKINTKKHAEAGRVTLQPPPTDSWGMSVEQPPPRPNEGGNVVVEISGQDHQKRPHKEMSKETAPEMDGFPTALLAPTCSPVEQENTSESTSTEAVEAKQEPFIHPQEDLTAVEEAAIPEFQHESLEPSEEVEVVKEQSLGDDWDFLLGADLGEDEPEASAPSAAETLSAVFHPDAVQDNIKADQLPLVIEEIQELIPEIEKLLDDMSSGSKKVIENLHRKVHTLKGTVGQVGAMRARTVIHHMETVMEELDAGMHDANVKRPELFGLFVEAKKLINPLVTGEWAAHQQAGADETPLAPVQAPKTVRVQAEVIDKMVTEVNESRLSGMAVEEFLATFKNKLKDLDENGQRVARQLREMELQADMQIQSRRTQVQEMGMDFDPLEFDRFTRLQELSRSMGEGISDILEMRREMTKWLAEQETLVAQQKRSILATQEKLHKTRLTPVDAINDRLHNVVWTTAREIGKDVTFEMSGGRVELDRVLLEKIISPLEHILRNSVAHGIEMPQDRLAHGKQKQGVIHMAVRQEAGRVLLEINDDGNGLRVDKIKEKAVEKGLWKIHVPMSDAQAAEMICTPGFSTADSVSQIAGRGVGMDVVRSEILGLGGRFEIVSKPRQGLLISIQLPTSIASASVLVVESGGANWAFPIEMVEHVVLLSKEALQEARSTNKFPSIAKHEEWFQAPFHGLDNLTGVHSSIAIQQDSAPVLLLDERGRKMVVEVSRLTQVFEVPLRSPGTIWGGVKGIAGTVILPSGEAIFLLDPFRSHNITNAGDLSVLDKDKSITNPLVMVVDDSLTVRKATVRFLTKNGYEHITAKDGQEALELLLRIHPDVILMDIEMPRMDGFDCTKNIRDNPRHADVPIIMITSRTADKHRNHALELGANAYLGKPFKDAELLKLLHQYAPRPSFAPHQDAADEPDNQ